MPKHLVWCSPEGTNNFETLTTLGSNFYLRRGIFQQSWDDGYVVDYFTNKKEGFLWDELKPHKKVRGHEDFRLLVNASVAKYLKIAKEKDRRIGDSQTRWVVSKAIDYVIKHGKFPKADMVWIEYIDPGLPAIVICMSLLIHYARQNVPIFVRDPELKFRYTTTLKPLHDKRRETIYEERIQRFITDEQLEDIRRKFVVLYAFDCDWATDEFPIAFEKFVTVYTGEYNRKIQHRKKENSFVYVGNVNGRQKMFERYYSQLKCPVDVWGRWPADFAEQMHLKNKRIKFKGIVPYSEMYNVLGAAKACIHITRADYTGLGSISDRPFEVASAGTLLLVPSEIKSSHEITIPDLVFDGPDEMNDLRRRIMKMSSSEYIPLVRQHREQLSTLFNPREQWERLLSMKENYW